MVTLLVGMIGSGKDGFIQSLADRGVIVVNDDDIVKAVHGGDYLRYREDCKNIYKQVELAIMLTAMDTKRDVVINRPNYRKSTRRRYIGIADAFEVPTVAVTFPRESPEVHAERRFKSDARGYTLERWIEVASRHAAEWEEPELDEGLDNIVPAEVAKQMVLDGTW